MYSTSFLVPVDGMTLTDQKSYRQGAINQAIGRALDLKIATNPDDLSVRLIRAYSDLAVGTASEEEWKHTLVAATANAIITKTGRKANQLIVFYGLLDDDANPQATLVTFKTASTGGTTKFIGDMQILWSKLVPEAMFSEAVVYDPQEDVYVDVNADGASVAGGERIVFLGFIVEPKGSVLS